MRILQSRFLLMNNSLLTPTYLFSPVQEIKNNLLQSKGVQLLVKRDDLINPQVSGNKWRKLKYNLLAAKEAQQNTLLTFGGAFSNHIYATAAAGKVFGFKTIGVIRGDHIEPLNATLAYAEKVGMELHFIARSEYRKKEEVAFQQNLQKKLGPFFLIPEGGTNENAIKGCSELVEEVAHQLPELPDYWCASCGTGGTLSGIIAGLNGEKKIIGFSALKGDFHQKDIQMLLSHVSDTLKVSDTLDNWQINTAYHFGGYAKFKPTLIDFINTFKQENNIQLEPIYTGKLFYGIYDLIKNDYFPKGSSILAVHTGGLQGIAGFNRRFGNLIR